MNQSTSRKPVFVAFGLAVLLTMATHGPARAQHLQSDSDSQVEPVSAAAFVQLCNQIYQTIDANHIYPPTRQEFALTAARALRQLLGIQLDHQMKLDVEMLVEVGDINNWLTAEFDHAYSQNQEMALPDLANLIACSVDPGATVVSSKEAAVQTQIRQNQYVGIGIQVRFDDGYAAIMQAFPGGAAHRAGAKSGDLILEVDGKSMEGLKLVQIIDVLRGALDTPVTVVVRNENEDQPRRLDMIRTVVPIPSVTGRSQNDDGSWEFTNEESSIGLMAVTAMLGSTARELADAANKLRLAETSRLVLDLRAVEDGEIHQAHVIADVLCGQGHFATLITRDGRKPPLTTSGESAFDGMKMAVLIPARTSGPVFALINQLAHRPDTILIGNVVQSDLACHASFDFPDAGGSIDGLTCALIDIRSLELPEDDTPDRLTPAEGVGRTSAVLAAEIREVDSDRQMAAAREWLERD